MAVDDVEQRAAAAAVRGAHELQVRLRRLVDAQRAPRSRAARCGAPGCARRALQRRAKRSARAAARTAGERVLGQRRRRDRLDPRRRRWIAATSRAVELLVVAQGAARQASEAAAARTSGRSRAISTSRGSARASSASSVVTSGTDGGRELAGGEIEQREAVRAPCSNGVAARHTAAVDRRQVVVGARVELIGLGDEPRRDRRARPAAARAP